MQKTKKISLILGVLVMSFAVGYLAFAWTDAPTGTAPYCPTGYSGCDAPIHVGSAGQTKTGALTLIGDLTAYRLVDYTDNTYYIDPANTGYAGLFAGKVGIGTTTPGQKLTVAGTIESTTGGFKFPDATIQTTAGTGGACVVSGNDIVCSGIPDNTAGVFQITKNGVTCPTWKDCDGDGRTYGSGDCDESCSLCYVGSIAYTLEPNGKDMNCNGVVDETESWDGRYYIYITATSYSGNLGGRSGADSKCAADANTPPTCAAVRAFMSVTDSDEVRDFPATWSLDINKKWYWWKNGTTALMGNNFADILDNSIANIATAVGYGDIWPKSGATTAGALDVANCIGWTSTAPMGSNGGMMGWTTKNTGQWLSAGANDCSLSRPIFCACLIPDVVYK